MGAPLIFEVKDLTIAIDEIDIVSNVSFGLKRRETVALVGESGCGKSLTALSGIGLLPEVARIKKGAIYLQDKEISNLTEKKMRNIRGNDISMIFQEPSSTLDPLMSIGKQIAEAVRAHHDISQQEAMQESLKMLNMVGIPEPETRLNQYPFELSGGMCQRIMIAIALICKPMLLIADEPTTALDVTIQAQTLDLMRSLKEETGTAILLITHDMGVVADMADRVMVMYAGNIVEHGDVFEIFKQPRHPYTRLLLSSIPHIGRNRKEKLNVIKGMVPDIHNWPTGCRFHPRCPLANETCRSKIPELQPIENTDQFVACWHHTLEIKP